MPPSGMRNVVITAGEVVRKLISLQARFLLAEEDAMPRFWMSAHVTGWVMLGPVGVVVTPKVLFTCWTVLNAGLMEPRMPVRDGPSSLKTIVASAIPAHSALSTR